jgi:hypothetical protein
VSPPLAIVDDSEPVLEAMAAAGLPIFHADWEVRDAREEAVLREAQQSEGRS